AGRPPKEGLAVAPGVLRGSAAGCIAAYVTDVLARERARDDDGRGKDQERLSQRIGSFRPTEHEDRRRGVSRCGRISFTGCADRASAITEVHGVRPALEAPGRPSAR